MFEPLFLTDMTLAVLAVIAALVLAAQASGDPARRRRWLRVTAALVAARLVVALLLLTGGLALADTRLIVQVPLAVLPIAVALRRPDPTTVHVGAAGVLLSVWWFLVPFGLQDAIPVVVGSVVALGVLNGLSVALGRWRRQGSRASRAPWLATAFLLVPAVSLALASQANAVPEEHHHPVAGDVTVDKLTGPRDREPDVRVTLTAAHTEVRLDSGRSIDALTFNGTAPGPEIRAEQGQLIEVTLVNTDVEQGVTVHWHGVDVPNAEDGVPGVTQDAVLPGQEHVYRFVPNRSGTFWYHTHRDALGTVQRGLFGALVIEDAVPSDVERTVFTHEWPDANRPVIALDRSDQPARQVVDAGKEVRLRLVNSSREPKHVQVGGTKPTVAAIDGNAAQGAEPVDEGTEFLLPAGGRRDLTFTMPNGPVTLAVAEAPDSAVLTYSPDGKAEKSAPTGGPLFDPLTYGSGQTPVPEGFDRTYDLRLDDGLGFSQGKFGYVSSLINGRLYPAVPTLAVAEGDRVKVRIANRSVIDHPMHLHGHRVRVLSRNGEPASGSPWWTDTLNVAPGEVYEIAFTADNPGIWMDHCHNFEHGADGMIMHLAYAGVSSPYSAAHTPE
ncbi:multicopper oxidase family protein [Umezawaea sp. Da 62-37]|uniref:multicopper oxidase family protein n=1 Tax=Umezawaea sp. Da 62-37 TaxID=3075927 RepID=UPI0028F73EF9|nr:multicopper oxidase family protein [Umezawaea sp. Da 62-37]WNV88063.1 multicopper oxidase family protein [Umezawaea sp. Da 62-37]